MKNSIEQDRHDAGESSGFGRQKRRVGHENEKSGLETRMLPDVSELGEQSREAAHRGADGERCEEHGAYCVDHFEELLHVKFGRVGCCTTVFFDRSVIQLNNQKFIFKTSNDKILMTYSHWANVIETASLRILSPNTSAYKLTLIFWSWKIANVVTFFK